METPISVKKPTVKSKKIILVILCAVIFAVLAAVGVYQITTPQRTYIYMFAENHAAGTQVTERMLTPVEVDANIIISNSRMATKDYYVTSSNINDVLTSAGVLRNDVYAGTALMTSMLTTTGGNSIEMTMKKNAVAVTVGASYITGVTDDIAVGSRVNVYANYEGSTTLLLENIRVLKVGRSSGALDSLTLEVTIAQSLQLINAYSFGSVHMGLVDATGYQFSDVMTPTYNPMYGFTAGSTTPTE